MPADPNRLLFIISAHGRMTWAEYAAAVDFLSQDTEGKRVQVRGSGNRLYLLQSLEALGHCDVDFTDTGTVIYVTPPVLCRLPKVGLPQAVLTGARSLDTVKHIRKAASVLGSDIQVRISRHPGLSGLMPDSIFIEATSEEALKRCCDILSIQYERTPPAWTLVNWCGALPDLEATLDYRLPSDLNWPRFDFRPNELAFVRTRIDSHPRLTRYRNPTTSLPMHVFFRNDRGAEVAPSWGRYLLFRAIALTMIAYDGRRFKVCVPIKAPLPALIARALCLCSGRLPLRLKRDGLIPDVLCSDWILYEQVPPQIAMAALSKVGQSPRMQNIEN